MSGAHDATVAVLDLQHREPGQAHRVPRVVEQVGPLSRSTLEDRRPEAVVRDRRLAQRPQAARDAGALALQIGSNDVRQGGDPALVLSGQTAGDPTADTEAEDDEWPQHHGGKAEQQAGAKAHRGIKRTVPSASKRSRGMPRRRTA